MNEKALPKTQSAAGLIRGVYQSAKKPIAFVLLILTGIGTVYPRTELQVAALGALVAIVLEVIFDIHKHLAPTPTGRHFSDFYEATEAMRSAIYRRLEQGRAVDIKAIGMSMGHAWTFLTNSVTNRIQKDGKRITLHIAMLDPSWDELPKINPDWAARCRTNFEEIERHASGIQSSLASSGSSISVSLYSHMPNWHGVLIDDEILFLSTCQWSNDRLLGGESRYEVVLASDPVVGYAKISHFRTWFDHALVQSKTRKWS